MTSATQGQVDAFWLEQQRWYAWLGFWRGLGAELAREFYATEYGREQRRVMMRWHLSHRFDAAAVPLADRHYNRRAIGSPQFVPPGRCMVLLTEGSTALWVTSWPFAEYVKHAWPGAWVNSLFRNERPDLHLSSELIREAVAATRAFFGSPPPLGMVTFVDADKTRRKRDPGRCYVRAGFNHVGFTKAGLYAFQMMPAEMPPACAAYNDKGSNA